MSQRLALVSASMLSIESRTKTIDEDKAGESLSSSHGHPSVMETENDSSLSAAETKRIAQQ